MIIHFENLRDKGKLEIYQDKFFSLNSSIALSKSFPTISKKLKKNSIVQSSGPRILSFTMLDRTSLISSSSTLFSMSHPSSGLKNLGYKFKTFNCSTKLFKGIYLWSLSKWETTSCSNLFKSCYVKKKGSLKEQQA